MLRKSPASKKQRFEASYDLAYRFQPPKTFVCESNLSRPNMKPGSNNDFTQGTGLYNKAYLTALASAQLSAAEAMQYSLGGGLLMLRNGNEHVNPSMFAQLDRMHLYEADGIRIEKRHVRIVPLEVQRTRSIARFESNDHSSSTSDDNIAPTNVDSTQSSVRKIIVEFLTKAELQLKATNRFCWPRSTFDIDRPEVDDRCYRSSDFPEIQIDRRSLGRRPSSRDCPMLREHCEVLGPHLCPDCVRTRAQNSHLRMCNATASANAMDVYKTALIQERVPQMTLGEIQRKVSDGEISNSINRVSSWQRTKRLPSYPCGDAVDHLPLSTTYIHDKAVSAPKPSSSKRSPQLKTIEGESTSDANTQDAAPCGSYEDDVKVEENEEFFDSTDTHSKPLVMKLKLTARTVRKRVMPPKKRTRVFNRHVVPSPNYFFDVSNLMDKVMKYRKYRKKSAGDIEMPPAENVLPNTSFAAAAGQAIRPTVMVAQAKGEKSSVSSLESVGLQKNESQKIFEPPITYGRRSQCLGTRPITADGIPTTAC